MQRPLRDALRGVATLADVSEDMLEPAVEFLPGPLRSPFRSALEALENAGARLVKTPLSEADIRVASDVLVGKKIVPQDLEICAGVIAGAWERLRHTARSEHHLMISETILAQRLASKAPISGETPGQRAASLLADLRVSPAIGRAPGVPGRHSPEDQREIDFALVTTLVWLLALRADGIEEEEKLLDLASALVAAMRADIFAAIDDPGQVARQLQSISTHL